MRNKLKKKCAVTPRAFLWHKAPGVSKVGCGRQEAVWLKISVSELVAEEIEEESLILRKKDRPQIYNPDEKYIFYDVLTPGPMKANLRMILVSCAPHAETYKAQFHFHPDEEVVYVLTGTATIIFETSTTTLWEGDTLRILANRKHRYKNDTDKELQFLTIKANRNY